MIEVRCSKAEGVRQLIDLALSAGRCRQSPQTGFVHYYYDTLDEPTQDAIPLFENFNFALVLLRSHNAEAHTEAKHILDRLLYFQSNLDGQSEGNFPRYMHEYPHCRDRFLAIHVLPTLYWIYKKFKDVLDDDLQHRLKDSIISALQYTSFLQGKGDLPFNIAIKAAAALKAFGELLGYQEYQERGSALLDALKDSCETSGWTNWSTPKDISDTLVALQLIYSSIATSPWSRFWKYVAYSWHKPSCTYVGPSYQQCQAGEEPKSTLYDLFLGYFAHSYSYRAFIPHPYQLQGAVIQATEDDLFSFSYPLAKNGSVKDVQWHIMQQSFCSYSVAEKNHAFVAKDKAFYPFRLVWGDGNRSHSVAMHAEFCSAIAFNPKGDGLELNITLDAPQGGDDEKSNRLLSFYCDKDPNIKVNIDNTTATTFPLDKEVTILSPEITLSLKFSIEAGSDEYLGHILPENRPSQWVLRGDQRFEVFDTSIFLRTTNRRSNACKVRVFMKVLPTK